jgi:hypothetical protein
MPSRRRSRAAEDPTLEALVAPLLGRSFDLRGAYEQKLQILTKLQREIELVRSAATPFPRRREGLENLEHHFQELARASRDAGDLLRKVRVEFDAIHREAHRIEKRQRDE